MGIRGTGWAAVVALGLSSSLRAADGDWLPAPLPPGVGNERNETARLDRQVGEYLSAYLAGRRPDPALRARLHASLRRSAQAKRLADPGYQAFARSLTPAEALNLFSEAVGRLTALYPDADRSAPDRLFALGRTEFDRALSAPSFRSAFLGSLTDAELLAFRTWLRGIAPPATVADARQAVRDVSREAQTRLRVAAPGVVALEFLAGACGGLDEFTAYLPPVDSAGRSGEYGDYGLTLAGGVVSRVEPLSWAAHVRLKPGDRVVHTERGPGAVRLTVAGRPTPVTLPVPPPTVFGAEATGMAGVVGYVRLAAFREDTPDALDDALLSLTARGVRAVVIDVRGNPGGHLAAAVHVAERFLTGGIVVTTAGRAPEFAGRVFSSAAGMTASTLPVVLLVDARTMSAAEVLAGAWKDHKRATLIGTQTFGKGTVQVPLKLLAADRPGAIRSGTLVLTVATMAGPNGRPLDGFGVLPDITEPDPDRQLELAIRRATELAAGMP